VKVTEKPGLQLFFWSSFFTVALAFLGLPSCQPGVSKRGATGTWIPGSQRPEEGRPPWPSLCLPDMWQAYGSSRDTSHLSLLKDSKCWMFSVCLRLFLFQVLKSFRYSTSTTTNLSPKVSDSKVPKSTVGKLESQWRKFQSESRQAWGSRRADVSVWVQRQEKDQCPPRGTQAGGVLSYSWESQPFVLCRPSAD